PGGSGLLRIGEIIRYEQVSTDPRPTSVHYRHQAIPQTLSFQSGYLPLIAYFSLDSVTRSTYHHHVNALYGLLDVDFGRFASTLTRCMDELINSKSFKTPHLSGSSVFKIITSVLYEYCTRFKTAVSRHPEFSPLIKKLGGWFKIWSEDIESANPTFNEQLATADIRNREFAVKQLRRSLETLEDVVNRAERATKRLVERPRELHSRNTEEAQLASLISLSLSYEGPGELREDGPRHDNDFESISEIRIAPTHDELCSPLAPFLPANFPGAPHHLPPQSMERLLDIQFRLLREELLAPIRSSITQVLGDLGQAPGTETRLQDLLSRGGGLYKSLDGHSPSFTVYAEVRAEKLECDLRRGLCCKISLNGPSPRARRAEASKRVQYWENAGRRRLVQGGLIALLWESSGNTRVYLGVVSSGLKELLDSAKKLEGRVEIDIAFFDGEAEQRLLRLMQAGNVVGEDTMLLVEAPVMFESIRPFLDALQAREPTSVPLARYLAHPESGSLKDTAMAPPTYATRPGFKLDVGCLWKPKRELQLHPSDEGSVSAVREELKADSGLDPSQADAIVDALMSEVSLIQGPPGTGKSFTGIELLRILTTNNIGPILLIAYTNHALDHILRKVLEDEITRKVVRLGYQKATDPFVAEACLLDTLVGNEESTRTDRNAAWRHFSTMKEVQEEMSKLMEEIIKIDTTQPPLDDYLLLHHPDHYEELQNPPYWIQHTFEEFAGFQDADGHVDTLMDHWSRGKDLQLITPPADGARPIAPPAQTPQGQTGGGRFAILSRASQAEDPASSSLHADPPVRTVGQAWLLDKMRYFRKIGITQVPTLPNGQRNIQALLTDPKVWRMSWEERQAICAYWTNQVREEARTVQTAEFDRLKGRLEEARTLREESLNAAKHAVLSRAQIIGCTTTGAAKSLTSLLSGVKPKVLLVEEAGQVLEAHILASLVGTIEHMILIGDPLQLRPTLANYKLSLDNPRSGHLYRFDESLIERLSRMGLKMSQLEVQRRMRPSIAELVRTTLYPKLEDHEIVSEYPPVRGMTTNVFFLDHRHAEEGGNEDLVSKTNLYEVHMVKDLVMHFLRQGCYSQRGDIIVLCAYLGQLLEIRKALSAEVTTVIDERDAGQLLDLAGNDELMAEAVAARNVKVSNQVILRTIDNFQGEEGTIVILSLVRNSGQTPARGRNVGFLNSENRTNVALSRAKEGLYILGNSEDLCRQSKMWRGVIAELKRNDQIGPGIPISCYLHPETVNIASEPGQLAQISPDAPALPTFMLVALFHRPQLFSYDLPSSVSPTVFAPRVIGNATTKAAWWCAGRHVIDCPAIIGVRTVSNAATIHVRRSAEQVVDLIMGTKMNEIDPNSDELADILITLPCRHTFTVETLDGHCGIEAYYTRRDGVWSELAATPTDIQKSLACPLCRGPVNAKRYGRIQRRADLDMAEQNVANSSRRALQEAERSVREFNLDQECGLLAQTLAGENLREPGNDEERDKPTPADAAKSEFIASKSLFPIDPEAMRGKTLRQFGLSIAAGRAWNKCIWNLVTAYQTAVTISHERFPLLRTYDAAVSELNRHYSQLLASGDLDAPDGVSFQDFALLKAKTASGFPAPPKAHLRFRVEAFWTAIDVRFKIVALIESLTLHPSLRNSQILEGLRAFNNFLMDCVQHDAQRAIDLAEESQSQRQVLRSALLLMRARWQAFAIKTTSWRPAQSNPAVLRERVTEAEAGCAKAKRNLERRRRAFLEKMGGHPDDQTWAYENFVQPAEEIVGKATTSTLSDSTLVVYKMPPKQRRLCDMYQRGHCRLGDNCKLLHATANEPATPPPTLKAPKTPKPPSLPAANRPSSTPHSRTQSAPPPKTPTAPASKFVVDLPPANSNTKAVVLNRRSPKASLSPQLRQKTDLFPIFLETPVAFIGKRAIAIEARAANSNIKDALNRRSPKVYLRARLRRQTDLLPIFLEMPVAFFGKRAIAIEARAANSNIKVAHNHRSPKASLSPHLRRLNPGQVHNKLKSFVQDGSQFRSSQEVYHFASILDSVHEFNDEWDYDDGQSFFEIISDPSKDWIHRIQNILLHGSVLTEGVNPYDLSFQRAYLPVLGYVSSRWVLRSTLRRNINALYGLLHQSFEDVDRVLQACIGGCMEQNSFSDGSTSVSGLRVFCTVTRCLFEYATHFKNAVSQHPCFADLVTKLVEWSEIWALAVCASPPQFNDPIADWSSDSKSVAIDRMKKSIDALFDVVAKAEGSTLRPAPRKAAALDPDSEIQILVERWNMAYDGPGIHHQGGFPRHDNDDEDVTRIQVVPTHGELTCFDDPYLPANIPGARHHLAGDSMERLVDIQFRLLREELIAPIRTSLLQVLDDLEKPANVKTQLGTLLEKGGGLYRTQSGADSVMFSMYTGVKFKNIDCDPKWGLSVNLEFDTPHGRARNPSPAKRAAYWESVGRKRLMQGGLIGLLWVPADATSHDTKFYVGTITSFGDDLKKSAVASPYTLSLKVSFFDSEAEVRILNALQRRRPDEEDIKVLIEAPIMFESIRPFLESLQSPDRPPPSIPFARYLALPDSGDLSGVEIDPPAYATPRFEFKLGCLFDSDQPVNLPLRPNDASSVQNARDALKAHSRLDPSQADAMVDVLTSEVSLIQGPPGTGKSFTGVELLRVLISSGVRPVLLIAFTNHAVDNIITHVLQKGITKKIIRLGARSSDPTVSQYTLDNILKTKPPSQADNSARRARQKVRDLEGNFSRLMSNVRANRSNYQEYLRLNLPGHFKALYTPPGWIQEIFEQSKGWNKIAGYGYRSHGLLDFWRNGGDLEFLAPPPVNQQSYPGRATQATLGRRSAHRFDDLLVDGSDEEKNEALVEPREEESASDLISFFARHNLAEVPTIPVGVRDLDDLHKDFNVWQMSLDERQRISEHWNTCMKELAWDNQKEEFNQLKDRHAEARKTLAEVVDRGKVELLTKADLICCTTNGAAKLANLLKSVGPKVLLVEEAGQVLEAHIISSLVPSIEHLILIGDPLQLRPTIENYHLSMDHPRTGKIYRFDQSLMERLFGMGLPMSQLDVQRRMRPQIANLIRVPLYPALQDHELVQSPPKIRGMTRDVFFLDHRNAEESGGDESASKTNAYEAKMIRDLVLYFLKQGKYTRTGDIVVLCAYLGQLAKVRKLLSNEVATVIDERDAVQLINHEDNDEAAEILVDTAEQVQVSKRILLRTVDNFQGEEGTIVILSLVRNSGDNPKAGRKIGFLKVVPNQPSTSRRV
ncbi:hypothetical protein FRC01_013709, partial [Tulasnella sp. 417]